MPKLLILPHPVPFVRLLICFCTVSVQPGNVLLHGSSVGADTQMAASPKAPALSSTSLPPQAAHEAQALANASETLKAQAQTLKVYTAGLYLHTGSMLPCYHRVERQQS